MTYKTTTGETPKTATLRVLVATLLALALLLGVRVTVAMKKRVCLTICRIGATACPGSIEAPT